MSFGISCNEVKVTDLDKTEDVCERYDFYGAFFSPDEQGVLRCVVDDELDAVDRWPRAFLVDEKPDIKTFDAFSEKGDEGFLAFLRDIAPLLETPLVILAVYRDYRAADATSWYVEPNGKVQVLTVGTD